jgi:hypothetical protein
MQPIAMTVRDHLARRHDRRDRSVCDEGDPGGGGGRRDAERAHDAGAKLRRQDDQKARRAQPEVRSNGQGLCEGA